MPKYDFTKISKEDFRELERQAWNGELDYSGFPPPEFKFFATVQALGARQRNEKIPAELFRSDIEAARNEYRAETIDFIKKQNRLNDAVAAIEQGFTAKYTHNGVPISCKISGVLSRFSGGRWVYSLELREVKSGCLIYAGLEEVEVKKNG